MHPVLLAPPVLYLTSLWMSPETLRKYPAIALAVTPPRSLLVNLHHRKATSATPPINRLVVLSQLRPFVPNLQKNHVIRILTKLDQFLRTSVLDQENFQFPKAPFTTGLKLLLYHYQSLLVNLVLLLPLCIRSFHILPEVTLFLVLNPRCH